MAKAATSTAAQAGKKNGRFDRMNRKNGSNGLLCEAVRIVVAARIFWKLQLVLQSAAHELLGVNNKKFMAREDAPARQEQRSI
jgi:hypothetical protein